ncbi:MAG: tetratricopeptide repeat protein [Prevotellaceae bacterium]|nr:tetratricopeptide repeat protein [Prevotellaceae bacterium]
MKSQWHGKKMKKISLLIIIIVAMLIMPNSSMAQTAKSDVVEAIDILKGKSLSKTAKWAADLLCSVEDDSLKPTALNAIGIAYLNGLGVEKDSTMAIKFFEEAGKCGYTNAYYNLGLMMKNAPLGKQDLKNALNYFEKGAELGALNCCYLAGYMYYKGLGCEQSYKRAVEYFKKDESAISLSCQYMLGLCYRNGFGVEIDEQKADEYLNKAARGNYLYAIEEILRDEAETQSSIILHDNDAKIEDSMPDVEPFIEQNTDLSGNYKGIIVTYDWSGKQIVKEENLDVTFNKIGESYSGVWLQGADTLTINANIGTDGILRFSDTHHFMKDRYFEDEKIESMFQEASISLVGPSLTGSLRLYSLTEREPQRPMYISLSKHLDDSAKEDPNKCYMVAYPVAGTDMVEIRFILPKDVKNSSIYLTDQNGLYTKRYNSGALSAGQQRFTISTKLNNGLYVVRMKADELHGQTTIMLK